MNKETSSIGNRDIPKTPRQPLLSTAIFEALWLWFVTQEIRDIISVVVNSKFGNLPFPHFPQMYKVKFVRCTRCQDVALLIAKSNHFLSALEIILYFKNFGNKQATKNFQEICHTLRSAPW